MYKYSQGTCESERLQIGHSIFIPTAGIFSCTYWVLGSVPGAGNQSGKLHHTPRNGTFVKVSGIVDQDERMEGNTEVEITLRKKEKTEEGTGKDRKQTRSTLSSKLFHQKGNAHVYQAQVS